MMSIWKDIYGFFFPSFCVSCDERLSTQEDYLCLYCLATLPRTLSHLYRQTPLEQVFWGRMPIERAVSFFYHEGESTKQIIWQMKYNSRPKLGGYIAQLYAREIIDSGFFDGIDIIIPVPLTWRKTLRRGYNQTHYIAEGISKVTGIPVVTNAVKKTKDTASQTNFNRLERLDNVDNVFRLIRPDIVRNKHILLVDDVLTTGATLCSLGKAIMSGAEGVRFSVLTLSLAGSLKGMPYTSKNDAMGE
ncbi:MAG: ComF family protein [Bacteroidaceae bacterium]|nr:ComF family protein [Bacteroidaceae bacterium]